MSPQEQEDAKVVKDLKALGRHVDAQLPYGWGFVLLAFPYGSGGRMNYIANANRADVVRAMYEFIEATKGKWSEHIPEQSSAAEDEQLGRARQRIAELERLAKRAADGLYMWVDAGLDPSLETRLLIDELRKAAES